MFTCVTVYFTRTLNHTTCLNCLKVYVYNSFLLVPLVSQGPDYIQNRDSKGSYKLSVVYYTICYMAHFIRSLTRSLALWFSRRAVRIGWKRRQRWGWGLFYEKRISWRKNYYPPSFNCIIVNLNLGHSKRMTKNGGNLIIDRFEVTVLGVSLSVHLIFKEYLLFSMWVHSGMA